MAELFFGDFRFDTRRLALEGPGGRVDVRPRTLQALTYLIAHRNRFVSREELMRELWPGVHVTGASVTQCISELRRALDDSAREPRYIETRVRVGYRFIATLYHKPTERLEPLPPPPVADERPGASFRGRRGYLPVVAAVFAGVLAVGAWVWWTAGFATRGGPIRVEVLSVASDGAGGLPEAMAHAIRRAMVLEVERSDGLVMPGPGRERPGLIVEVATRGTSAGRLEVVAVLRAARDGRELWGWTWLVPADGASVEPTAERIARRIAAAAATRR